MGAAMKLLGGLFAANKFEKRDQGRVGGNGLPLAHHALRVNNFASEHGATVHGKLQDMNHFFAAVHFHVCARRHKESTALSFLRRSVIEQTPERSNGSISLDGSVVDINNAGIGRCDFLPFGVSRLRSQQRQNQEGRGHDPLNSAKVATFGGWIFENMCKCVHALYYKVAQPS